MLVLWHVDPKYGTLALAVTLSRLVQGQFDLFWVAAQVSIPFVIAGICLGAQALSVVRANQLADDPPVAGDIRQRQFMQSEQNR